MSRYNGYSLSMKLRIFNMSNTAGVGPTIASNVNFSKII